MRAAPTTTTGRRPKWVGHRLRARCTSRQGQGIDPVALLIREHGEILERLRQLEISVTPLAHGKRRESGSDYETLRELLRFFTDQVRVHFKREALLITALGRTLDGRGSGRKGIESLLMEHRALRTDAASIARRLNAKATRRGKPWREEFFRIKAFVRQYRTHMAWEERILFVLAPARLTAEQMERIGGRMLEV